MWLQADSSFLWWEFWQWLVPCLCWLNSTPSWDLLCLLPFCWFSGLWYSGWLFIFVRLWSLGSDYRRYNCVLEKQSFGVWIDRALVLWCTLFWKFEREVVGILLVCLSIYAHICKTCVPRLTQNLWTLEPSMMTMWEACAWSKKWLDSTNLYLCSPLFSVREMEFEVICKNCCHREVQTIHCKYVTISIGSSWAKAVILG